MLSASCPWFAGRLNPVRGEAQTTEVPGPSEAVPTRLTVAVYTGARNGNRPEYVEAAQELGREIARRGWNMVYGGGTVGLMRVVADAYLDTVMAEGLEGNVEGVTTERLRAVEGAYDAHGSEGHFSLNVVPGPDFDIRKATMEDHSDFAIALPGGAGTGEEALQYLRKAQFGSGKYIGFANVGGFWNGLKQQMERAVGDGLISESDMSFVAFDGNTKALLDTMEQRSAGVPFTPEQAEEQLRNHAERNR